MVVANLMTLCEIQPKVAHRWFMEMYVDANPWVMGPNGMAWVCSATHFCESHISVDQLLTENE